MPGSGPIDKKDKWHIEIELGGPLDKDKSDEFTAELKALLKKYRAKMTEKDTRPKNK
ncbi:MAG TPA: hypothetical protein VL948_06315 [Verrucomicrobiae bacterium]|jgi:hypothetical protein|nr:hypothetical protein [Verrucomicrobiae bacterium]